jgi:hypothetical protein
MSFGELVAVNAAVCIMRDLGLGCAKQIARWFTAAPDLTENCVVSNNLTVIVSELIASAP